VLNTHTPSGAEVEGRVELYHYSPSGPSWPVLGRTLPLALITDVGNVARVRAGRLRIRGSMFDRSKISIPVKKKKKPVHVLRST